MLDDIGLTPLLFAISGLLALFALTHAFAVRRHWRARRHIHAMHRSLWLAIFLCLAIITGGLGASLTGYRRLTGEVPVATLAARQLGPQDFSVRIDFPDGSHRSGELRGDEWQLDARVIKWTPRAVTLGAEPLYRLDRLSGRYRDAAQAQSTPPSVVPLGEDSTIDLWQLKHRFPTWLPWIDADYGSAAYLPLIDGGDYTASLSPLGGLVARPADKATADKIKASGW
ncbi:MAG TPA: hypothetical protein VFB32_14875 [Rudaea sp.]|nr:hypothetical protein [Rudaea sp.]